jgi:serine/threonine protein kinase
LLEYISGAPLIDLEKIEIFSDQTRVYILRQLAQSLVLLKKLKILHRDIKPDNILIYPNKSIKIIDFGLSAVYIKDQKLKRAGTPGFLAPEILKKG